MSNRPQWTLQRETVLLDSTSMISTLAGFFLMLFSANARSPLCWWLGIAAWVIAIVLAITASLLNPDMQTHWRQRIRGMSIIFLSSYSIYFVFDAVTVITHQELFEWLGFVAIMVIVLPGMFFLTQIMRRRMKVQSEGLLVSKQ